MSNRQVAVGRSPVKRQSKAWVRESTGNLSILIEIKKLTADSCIIPNGYQSWKHGCKCY